MEQNDIRTKYVRTIRDMFNTIPGEEAAKMLRSNYVDVSAICQTPEHTAYKLGQKELIQDLLRLATITDEEIQAVVIGGSENE